MALYTSEKFILSEYSDGTSPYTLSLDNDSDVIVVSSEGKFIGVTAGTAITSVSGKLYEGNTEVTATDFSITIDETQAVALFGKKDKDWEFKDNSLKIYNLASKAAQIGTITFIAKKGEEAICEKKFTFKVIVSSVDYDLVVSKRVVNKNSDNKTVSVGIIKKDENGSIKLTTFEQNSPIKIKYGTTEVSTGNLPTTLTISSNTTIQLLSSDGTFIWDEETIEIVENGLDGKSFRGVIEYYKANNSSTEYPDGFVDNNTEPSGWSTTIADAGHSETNKYLWNIEGVTTKDEDGEQTTYTAPDLVQVWNGRTVKQIYSYYAVSTNSATEPEKAPYLGENGNNIITPEDTEWELNGLTSAPDQATYLWETTITEYNSKDVNEKNQYEQIPPHVIGYNGADAYHMELDNDNDVIAIAGGNPIGLPITVTGKIYSGSTQITGGTWGVSVPTGWQEGQDKNYSFNGGVLTLRSLYNNAPSGQFTIEWWINNNANTSTSPLLSKTFSYSTVESPYDWDLFIDKSTINTSDSSQQSINVQVKKKDSGGTTIYNIEDIPNGSNIAVYKGTTSLSKSAQTLSEAATFTIKQLSADGNIPQDFVWDSENVGAIRNGNKGDSAISYQLVVSPTSFKLTYDEAGEQNTLVPKFSVIRSNGFQIEEIELTEDNCGAEQDYQIDGYNLGNDISETTTFDLLVNTGNENYVKVDSKTITLINDGDKGDSVVVTTEYAYYLSNKSTPPQTDDGKPIYPTGTENNTGNIDVNSGWTSTPQSLSMGQQFQYVSSRIVTTTKGPPDKVEPLGWTAPVLWAKYGSDASVNTYNTFNALTNDGKKQGIYYGATKDGTQVKVTPKNPANGDDGYIDENNETYDADEVDLYINASMIKTGVFEVSRQINNEVKSIFSADAELGYATIGGFSATNTSLTSTDGIFEINSTPSKPKDKIISKELLLEFQPANDSPFCVDGNYIKLQTDKEGRGVESYDFSLDYTAKSIIISDAFIYVYKNQTIEVIKQLESEAGYQDVKALLTISNSNTRYSINANTDASKYIDGNFSNPILVVKINYTIEWPSQKEGTYLKIGNIKSLSLSFGVPSSADGVLKLYSSQPSLQTGDKYAVSTPLSFISFENASVKEVNFYYYYNGNEYQQALTKSEFAFNGDKFYCVNSQDSLPEECDSARLEVEATYDAYDFSVSKDGKINSPTIEYLIQNSGSGSGSAIIQQKINFATKEDIEGIFKTNN